MRKYVLLIFPQSFHFFLWIHRQFLCLCCFFRKPTEFLEFCQKTCPSSRRSQNYVCKWWNSYHYFILQKFWLSSSFFYFFIFENGWRLLILTFFDNFDFYWTLFLHSCSKITKTWIKFFLQKLKIFFSNISHQMMI